MTTRATIRESASIEAIAQVQREPLPLARPLVPARLPPALKERPLTGLMILQATLLPALAMIVLMICARISGQPLGGPILILAVLAFALACPGRSLQSRRPLDIVAAVLADWLIVVGILLALGWATQAIDLFEQRLLLAWIIATPLTAVAAEFLLIRFGPVIAEAAGWRRTAVIVGNGPLARQLAGTLECAPLSNLRVVGTFDDRALPRDGVSGGEVIGPISVLANYVREHRIDLIYITLPMAAQPRVLTLLHELRDTTASVYFTPDIFLPDLIQARVDSLDGMPIIAVCETPHYGINGPIKRATDLVLGSLILLMILPLLLIIAVIVKVESPGPVIFRQRRYGLDGREIMVWKFRTMKVTEDGATIRQATRDDPRITRFGGFLRRTSLDELPQFINVLQGTMSIVGPRPHAVAHNEQYRKLIDGYMLRHKVKPGITGWAQVNGLRGETDTLDKMSKRIEYDLAYLRNWSLRNDLEIILKTPLVAWKKENAY
jgi:putative colanic acid biosynthesis UDP-glucose lipid carrier transferase